MAEVIYKYPLGIAHSQTIKIHKSASFLTVINQNDVPVVYARVDLKQPLIDTLFHIYATGEVMTFDPDFYDRYLGTITVNNGMFVFHVHVAEDISDLPF